MRKSEVSRGARRLFRLSPIAVHDRLGSIDFSHRRNPPRNALALLTARQAGGSSLSSFTFPPPSTTSFGSSAAARRATTSATQRRHFFLPNLSNPRSPT